ncbi:saccharopine dehydrogenase [Flagelloscypha sp. PMI_526]|nr:saccharopine dehydrogenase [Flagelloscypha sp. PMI_526]
MSKPAIWLRCEKKGFGRRSALSPATSKCLIEAGFDVFVERDTQRIFQDEEFEIVGAKLVKNGSWSNAPQDIPILGLKELPISTDPLSHSHIHFAHCYKGQAGWSKFLARFYHGGGTLYDLEYLTDESNRRVAAFGFHAGFSGAAVGLLAVTAAKRNEILGKLNSYSTEVELIDDVKAKLGENAATTKALVIGAFGRCGRGAIDLFRKAGLKEENILKWDIEETAIGGPFPEILQVDIFVNCIYLNSSIPPFITNQSVEDAGLGRQLSVVVDVSCDTTNPFNPIPIYSVNTTFDEPTVPMNLSSGFPALSVISIDQLPALLPREASEQFSADLLPSLLQLPQRAEARVWTDAEKVFKAKLGEAVKQEGL